MWAFRVPATSLLGGRGAILGRERSGLFQLRAALPSPGEGGPVRRAGRRRRFHYRRAGGLGAGTALEASWSNVA